MTDDKMSEGSDDHSDHQGSHKKRRRGLAKGAEGAKYCSMSAETRLAQYPDAPLAVRVTDQLCWSWMGLVLPCNRVGCESPGERRTRPISPSGASIPPYIDDTAIFCIFVLLLPGVKP